MTTNLAELLLSTRDAGTPALPLDMIEDDGYRVGLRHTRKRSFGSIDVRLFYHSNGHVVTLMERNNLTSDSKGAVELDYSFPLYGKVKGYVQYFYGYGESLIDYDARTNRVSAGVAISDWF